MYILNCVFLWGGFPGRDTENVYLSFPFLVFIYAIFFIIIFFNKDCMKKVILKNVPLLILGQSFQVHAGSCYLLTPLVSNSLLSSLGYIYIFFFQHKLPISFSTFISQYSPQDSYASSITYECSHVLWSFSFHLWIFTNTYQIHFSWFILRYNFYFEKILKA